MTVTEDATGPARPEAWQQGLATAVRDPDELIERLELGEEWREPARRAARLFPLLVPRSFLDRMERGNPRDPLLLQVLPLGDEELSQPDFVVDAVGDQDARRAPGLLQKYVGRALMIAAGACAVHCRYCFRRHYAYGDDPKRLEDWEPALQVLRNDDSIHELILSGGDPLMLTDRRLELLFSRIREIPHIRRLRVHTRLPIVLPERVTSRLVDLLTAGPQPSFVVVHANHPRELSDDCATALRHLVLTGNTVLNQAVLLRGVNDNLETLVALSEGLVDLGVIPYYLHQLDRVAGTGHFEVPESRGLELVAAMRSRLPGYAIPQYVREVAGESHKLPINTLVRR